jgi:hypothetical protein
LFSLLEGLREAGKAFNHGSKSEDLPCLLVSSLFFAGKDV